MTIDEIVKARVEEFKSADEKTRIHMLNELDRSLRDRGIKQNDVDRTRNAILCSMPEMLRCCISASRH